MRKIVRRLWGDCETDGESLAAPMICPNFTLGFKIQIRILYCALRSMDSWSCTANLYTHLWIPTGYHMQNHDWLQIIGCLTIRTPKLAIFHCERIVGRLNTNHGIDCESIVSRLWVRRRIELLFWVGFLKQHTFNGQELAKCCKLQ